MDNSISMEIIFFVSLVLGSIKFGSLETAQWRWQQKFAEVFNNFLNFLIPGLIGYYFILVRWPLLVGGEALKVSDFVLLAIFAMGLFGHLCVLSLNITEGVKAILDRVLTK